MRKVLSVGGKNARIESRRLRNVANRGRGVLKCEILRFQLINALQTHPNYSSLPNITSLRLDFGLTPVLSDKP